MDLTELNQHVTRYQDNGFTEDVNKAVAYARKMTRDFIARTHPKTAFGGKDIVKGSIIRGKYDIQANVTTLNIYSTYFARWYATGIRGAAPRGDYYGSHKASIESYFAQQVMDYLKKNISL